MKREMTKEEDDVGEAGEKKQGRNACFPFQVVRPSPRASGVSAYGTYLLTILVVLD